MNTQPNTQLRSTDVTMHAAPGDPGAGQYMDRILTGVLGGLERLGVTVEDCTSGQKRGGFVTKVSVPLESHWIARCAADNEQLVIKGVVESIHRRSKSRTVKLHSLSLEATSNGSHFATTGCTVGFDLDDVEPEEPESAPEPEADDELVARQIEDIFAGVERRISKAARLSSGYRHRDTVIKHLQARALISIGLDPVVDLTGDTAAILTLDLTQKVSEVLEGLPHVDFYSLQMDKPYISNGFGARYVVVAPVAVTLFERL